MKKRTISDRDVRALLDTCMRADEGDEESLDAVEAIYATLAVRETFEEIAATAITVCDSLAHHLETLPAPARAALLLLMRATIPMVIEGEPPWTEDARERVRAAAREANAPTSRREGKAAGAAALGRTHTEGAHKRRQRKARRK